MKILKSEINLFTNLLVDCDITLAEARKRDAVLKQLVDFSKTTEEERLKIIDKFGEKEDGKLVVKNNKYILIKETLKEFEEELDKLFEEEVELTVDTQSIKTTIEKTKYIPKAFEMESIDKIISKIE